MQMPNENSISFQLLLTHSQKKSLDHIKGYLQILY